MDFYERTGRTAIGSRLRRLTDRLTKEAAQLYALYGVELRPKWFPVFTVLAEGEPRTITEIAREIGHTHPSVSNIVKEMRGRGIVSELAAAADRRCNRVALTPKGAALAETLRLQCEDVGAAIDRLCDESRFDLWRAIGAWEALLDERSLAERVKEVRRERERRQIEIIPYEDSHQPLFRALNEAWITTHWRMEEADYKALDHPREYILDRGGEILIARYCGEAVGVCALLKSEDPRYDYELAKYAVSPKAQGHGVGLALGEAAVARAAELGGRRLFLESNTLLKPAIGIYRKLGFRELPEQHPAYARGDIQMELTL